MPRQAPSFWATRNARSAALLPLAALFGVLAGLRRRLYRSGLLKAERLPVPVIVVGNIAVGGSGKTPVAHWLAGQLRAAGRRPGIVSRGYGGRVEGCALVPADGDPGLYGDEPVLLARLTGCPVAVGADRPAAARALLAAHPECDVIVCDDGLQHYRLARDVELAVVDEATLGNRWRLPSGPLREGLERLREVDAVFAHGALSPALQARLEGCAVYPLRLGGARFRALDGSGREVGAEHFHGQRVHALAGIGRPQRFFEHLRALGLEVDGQAFPDHHHFLPADLAPDDGRPRVMTSKDAVKCAAFAPANCWELPVVAEIPPDAAQRILEKLPHGRQTA
ncbi:tetraacyldisaccharide 4'-kinase [Pseudothauera nasutitermitis]|uniref:Tetraacyldisaccharide 4'-kinase n=1 Tax=Pseudothauera nasutitermitis TaxID=2565930 RepID=A0A4S4B306_9RHOO|nr:tetraacyldisaccharide 4'-kinase [Pseudothauera nasutitermitis]THF66120.1 tetraacyldisaccharide 4'-kinase [Pseudothauera nasutitermitis]